MANNNVLRGNNAVLTLAAIDQPAGQLAQQIFDTEYSMTTVGRCTGVEVHVTTDLEVFHEIGTRMPTDIVPGNINICGKADRAFVNGALIRLLLGKLGTGDQNQNPDFHDELQPKFNMLLTLGANRPGEGVTVTLFNVHFDDWSLVVPEDDFVMEKVTFKALRVERTEFISLAPVVV
jgi:hypothetical protein